MEVLRCRVSKRTLFAHRRRFRFQRLKGQLNFLTNRFVHTGKGILESPSYFTFKAEQFFGKSEEEDAAFLELLEVRLQNYLFYLFRVEKK